MTYLPGDPVIYPHRLKGRHESPNFRKPFCLVEPHRHLGPTPMTRRDSRKQVIAMEHADSVVMRGTTFDQNGPDLMQAH
jgi:hypothetical protein